MRCTTQSTAAFPFRHGPGLPLAFKLPAGQAHDGRLLPHGPRRARRRLGRAQHPADYTGHGFLDNRAGQPLRPAQLDCWARHLAFELGETEQDVRKAAWPFQAGRPVRAFENHGTSVIVIAPSVARRN